MMAPLEKKSRLGGMVDWVGARLLLLALSCLWFYRLWGNWAPALIAGTALAVLLWCTLGFWNKHALRRREETLRTRLGGTLALEELLLCDATAAATQVAVWLTTLYPLEAPRPVSGGVLVAYADGPRHTEETLYLRCFQAPLQQAASADDVLKAARACRALPEPARCVLCCPSGYDSAAQALAEALEPSVRLIDGALLRALAGRLHPATDQQLVALGQKQRQSFAWATLRRQVFSPQKTRRYLWYGAGLMVFFIITDHLYYLLAAGLCLALAMLSQRRQRRPERL